jgi:meso-butanediol dehydrogenase/(S,S)-butanediol dehydrogenase/diacetyl reductase
MGKLAGRTALITGSGTGIGAAMASLFAFEDAHVIVSGDREPALVRTADAIRAAGGSVETVVCDVTDEDAVARTIREVASRRGRLDILVNNAFRMSALPIAEMTTSAWRDSFSVALDAVFYATRAALPLMTARGGGAILNISSTAGHAALPALAGYSSAKAALEAFTRVAAVEGAPGGVRVNALAPGCIATPGTLSAFPTEQAQRAMHRLIPLGRFGDPAEVARAALFLVSDDASFVTGTCLIVDGGQRAYLGAPAIDEGFVHGSDAVEKKSS